MFLALIKIALYGFTIVNSFYRAEKLICRPSNCFKQIFAPPGTGKTTLAAKIVKDSNAEGKQVYSNVPIISAKEFNLKDLGVYDFSNSTIIIDEAGAKIGNRDWHKNLNKEQIEALKLHRHDNIDIYLFSQAYDDVDKKFRDLTTQIVMLSKSKIPFFVKGTAIKKTMQLINGQILQFFEIDKANCFKFFVVDKWAYFNSYQSKKLPKKENEMHYMKSDTI